MSGQLPDLDLTVPCFASFVVLRRFFSIIFIGSITSTHLFYSLANFFCFELCGGDGVWFLHNVKKLPEAFPGFVLKIYSSVLLPHSSFPIASSDIFGVPDFICQ